MAVRSGLFGFSTYSRASCRVTNWQFRLVPWHESWMAWMVMTIWLVQSSPPRVWTLPWPNVRDARQRYTPTKYVRATIVGLVAAGCVLDAPVDGAKSVSQPAQHAGTQVRMLSVQWHLPLLNLRVLFVTCFQPTSNAICELAATLPQGPWSTPMPCIRADCCLQCSWPLC